MNVSPSIHQSVHQLQQPLPQTVAVVRALPGLGDLLCCVPALRALRSALPNAKITLIGLPSAKAFVQRFHAYVDELLEFPGFPGIPEVAFSAERVTAFLTQVQQRQFDLALQLHGSGASINAFLLLLGAKDQAGFFPTGQFCPDVDRFFLYPEAEPEIWRNLRLMQLLGIPLQGDYLEFPLQMTDWQEWERISNVYALTTKSYVCIHPGASVGERCWLPQHFATVADTLARQGYSIVLTGTADEIPLTQTVAQSMRYPVLDLAGQTGLGGIATLLKNARLLICNDTGVSHLAAALQVRSVVIFSNSDPQRWAPLDRQQHRVVGVGMTKPRIGSPALAYPTPALVLGEAIDLLNQEQIYAS